MPSFSLITLLSPCYTGRDFFFLPPCQGASLLLDFSLLLCFVPALPPGSSCPLLALSFSVPLGTILSSHYTSSTSPAPWLSQCCTPGKADAPQRCSPCPKLGCLAMGSSPWVSPWRGLGWQVEIPRTICLTLPSATVIGFCLFTFFCPVRNCLLKKAHFSCLLGVPVCHFYKSVFIGLIIVNAEPNKGDCDCNI